jgi:hypothetical protein
MESQQCVGWAAVALASLNLLNILLSSWNARRLMSIRDEQHAVKATLADHDEFVRNGKSPGHNGSTHPHANDC